MDLKNIFVYLEIADNKITKSSLESLSVATQIIGADEEIIGILLEKNDLLEKSALSHGAHKCITINNLIEFNLDNYVNLFQEIIKKYSPRIVLFGSNQFTKEISARLSVHFNTSSVNDVVALKKEDNNLIWTCQAYGGIILRDIVLENNSLQLLTIRSGAFKKIESSENSDHSSIISENFDLNNPIKSKIVEVIKEISENVDLESAEVIVAGGRGMGNLENFQLLKELSDVLGGVIGATRPAIEEGWVSKAHQIGQSGKIVAPKLYIACGISGAVQHVSGMRNSDFIIAINKDEDAPIFDVANIGIVANVTEAIPMLITEFKNLKN